MGQYQIVALNRGSAHGLEPGHVLAIYQGRRRGARQYSKGGLDAARAASRGGSKVQLPDERVGAVMVFKAFDRMSYALVDGIDARDPRGRSGAGTP